MPRSVTICAEPLQQFRQQNPVGIENRRGAAGRARLDHFITGGKNRDLEPPAHRKLGQSQGGSERDVLRFKHGAGRQNDATGGNILARETAIGPELQAFWHRHPVAFDRHILLHENGVGALRHRRAGENANGLTRLERQTSRARRR